MLKIIVIIGNVLGKGGGGGGGSWVSCGEKLSCLGGGGGGGGEASLVPPPDESLKEVSSLELYVLMIMVKSHTMTGRFNAGYSSYKHGTY